MPSCLGHGRRADMPCILMYYPNYHSPPVALHALTGRLRHVWLDVQALETSRSMAAYAEAKAGTAETKDSTVLTDSLNDM